MSFLLSKIVWALLDPVSLLLAGLLLAFMLHRRRPRTARTLVGALAAFAAALIAAPVAGWVTGPLESRFPRLAALPEHVDGVIVLGGFVYARESKALGQPQLNGAAERFTELVALARRYPQARIVFTGGSGLVRGQEWVEADAVAAALAPLGIDPTRVIFERRSRNTWENAVFSKALVSPRPGENWLLVTSAWHMPRSMGIFRNVGWTVTADPVDFVASADIWLRLEAEDELLALAVGVKEWIGLIAYHLMGRTDAWLPRAEAPTAP